MPVGIYAAPALNTLLSTIIASYALIGKIKMSIYSYCDSSFRQIKISLSSSGLFLGMKFIGFMDDLDMIGADHIRAYK